MWFAGSDPDGGGDLGPSLEPNLSMKSRSLPKLLARVDRWRATFTPEMLAAAEADGAKTDGSEQIPWVLLVVGVNGVGKTTSIAKLTQLHKKEGKKVILGAADTFRAAAIEQLQSWGHRLDADVIAHRPDADPGAVAFDTLQAAKARGADVVIIDTAGRLHTKVNLMEEIKKIQRVLARRKEGRNQRVLLALDATTGQNGHHQAHAQHDTIWRNPR